MTLRRFLALLASATWFKKKNVFHLIKFVNAFVYLGRGFTNSLFDSFAVHSKMNHPTPHPLFPLPALLKSASVLHWCKSIFETVVCEMNCSLLLVALVIWAKWQLHNGSTVVRYKSGDKYVFLPILFQDFKWHPNLGNTWKNLPSSHSSGIHNMLYLLSLVMQLLLRMDCFLILSKNSAGFVDRIKFGLSYFSFFSVRLWKPPLF